MGNAVGDPINRVNLLYFLDVNPIFAANPWHFTLAPPPSRGGRKARQGRGREWGKAAA